MVVIYSLKGCPFCEQLKEGLEKEGIEYKDKDIDIPKYEEEFDKISSVSNTESIPVMLIGKQIFAPDVSFKTIEECIGLAKKFSQP